MYFNDVTRPKGCFHDTSMTWTNLCLAQVFSQLYVLPRAKRDDKEQKTFSPGQHPQWRRYKIAEQCVRSSKKTLVIDI